MIRILSLLLVLLLAPLVAVAAPGKPSTSGTYSTGQTVTISGSGFGTKAPAAPILWAPFDSNMNPSILGRATSWQYNNCIEWTSNGRAGGGVKTLDTCSRTDTALLGINTGTLGVDYTFNAYGQKSYIFRHRKMGYTNDVNLKSIELIGADYNYDANWVFNHSSNQWISQQLSPSSYFYGISQVPAENAWATEEHIFQMNTTSGAKVLELEVWGNGVKRLDVNQTGGDTWFITGRDSTSSVDDMRRINPVFHGDYNISSGSMSTTPEYFDSVYVDNTWSRVMIGNESTWAASTQREIQIPTAWSESSISVSFNQGSFTNGQTVYLYVIDANGEVSPASDPITVSGMSPTITGRTRIFPLSTTRIGAGSAPISVQ